MPAARAITFINGQESHEMVHLDLIYSVYALVGQRAYSPKVFILNVCRTFENSALAMSAFFDLLPLFGRFLNFAREIVPGVLRSIYADGGHSVTSKYDICGAPEKNIHPKNK